MAEPIVATDLMVDIETLATSDDAAIVQIGLCAFDRVTGAVGEPTTYCLDWREQKDRRIDPETLAWWLQQSPEAVQSVLVKPLAGPALWTLEETRREFAEEVRLSERIWANDPTFDLKILRHAGFDCGSFRKERSCRTVFDQAETLDVLLPPRTGVTHRAGDDAFNQARAVCAVYARLYELRELRVGARQP